MLEDLLYRAHALRGAPAPLVRGDRAGEAEQLALDLLDVSDQVADEAGGGLPRGGGRGCEREQQDERCGRARHGHEQTPWLVVMQRRAGAGRRGRSRGPVGSRTPAV